MADLIKTSRLVIFSLEAWEALNCFIKKFIVQSCGILNEVMF